MKRSGKRRSSAMASSLPAHEAGIAHRVAHLLVVLERHLRDRLGVGRAASPRTARTARPSRRCRRAAHRAPCSPRRRRSCPGRETARSRAPHRRAAAPGRARARARRAPCRADPAGGATNSVTRCGMSATASGNSRGEERPCRRGARAARRNWRPARARNSVAVKLPSVLGRAISMKPPRGQMCSAWRSSAGPPPAAGHGELLVVMVEPLLAHAG